MESVNTENIDKQAVARVEEAGKFQVIDNPSFEKAGTFLLAIKEIRKEINVTFDSIISAAHATHKKAVSQKKKHSEPLDTAEKTMKNKIGLYLADCRRKQAEEQRRLEEIARKEREEKLKQEMEERKKKDAEAVRQAQLAQDAGDKEAAEEILNEAAEETAAPLDIEVAPVTAPKVETKVKGISQRKVWKWKLKDRAKVNSQFLMVDDKKINQIVRSMGQDATNVVGGIQVYDKYITAGRPA